MEKKLRLEMISIWRFCIIWLSIAGQAVCHGLESFNPDFAGYSEHLLLRPLPQSSLLASFNFRSNTSNTAFDAQNFRYFSRALGQILQHAFTRELHLRFSSGRWDTENWGDKPWGGSREGGTGVELWAWVEASDETEATARWLTLTNALSGLFCASLNFVDETRTIRPAFAFSPDGQGSKSRNDGLHLLHGSLPNEVVCTENLTPFLKLLPCKGKAGISSLLDGHKLFDSSWQTMAIDIRPMRDGEQEYIEMEQTIDMVLNIDRAKRLKDDPIPRPLPLENISCDTNKPYGYQKDSCFPVEMLRSPAFRISDVFGKVINGACPLTNTNSENEGSLCIDMPSDRWKVVSNQDAHPEGYNVGTSSCMALLSDVDFDIELQESSAPLAQSNQHDTLLVERTITGQGQQYGGLQAVFSNPSSTASVRFVYLETLPWFMKPYFHTLKASLITTSEVGFCGSKDPIVQMHYRPSVDRIRASHMEMILEIPQHCKLELSYDFEKSILRYAEYPPDANRGFDVPPAVIRMLPHAASEEALLGRDLPRSLRTTSLLLYLPTPDFSMPYNTIILTSTVIALAFGSIYNILVRRFVSADEIQRSKRLRTLVIDKLNTLRTRLRSYQKTKAE